MLDSFTPVRSYGRVTKKLTPEQKYLLADPDTTAAMVASMKTAYDRYGWQVEAVWEQIQALMRGRLLNALSDEETLALASLHTHFAQLANEQEAFRMEHLAARLNPDEGDEPVNG